MSDQSGAGSTSPSGATDLPPGQEWPDEVTRRIESAVGAVRDKTTVPITKVARIVVFGLIIAVGALVALLLLVIATVRVLDVYLPFHPYGRRVWVVEGGFGAVFLLIGSFCWTKRSPRKS